MSRGVACDASARLLSQVYLIHRRDEFRASKIMQKRTLDNPKIEVLYSTVAEEAYGSEKGLLGGLKIRDLKTDEVPRPGSCLLYSFMASDDAVLHRAGEHARLRRTVGQGGISTGRSMWR